MDQPNPLIFLHTVENVKYAKPSCCAHGAPPSSQTAAEHMFRHALICLLIPLEDGIDRDRLVVMALIHDITDFRPWDGQPQRKQLNMDYLTCNLPTEATMNLTAHWSEYWDGKTLEAQLAHEICAFEHLIALDEDGEPTEDFYQPAISSPELQGWLRFLDSSKGEMKDLQNNASFGSSYWNNPDENMRLLKEVIENKSAISPLPFIRMLRDMSTIQRRGWVTRGLEPEIAESNASHSWLVALICLLFSPGNEALKSAILGLVHDVGEIGIGDVIPSDGISKEDKRLHERFCQEYLAHLSQTSTMEQYFTEFEAPISNRSDAAQIAHEADSLECRIQASRYILRYPKLDELLDFLKPTPKAVYFPNLTDLLLEEETSLREKRSQGTQLKVIYVLGPPGVGKDTQCEMLAKEFDCCHVPTGDLLRNEMERTGSRYSKFIRESILNSFLVPADLMVRLIYGKAKGLVWILNGYPRNLDQLLVFQQQASPRYSTLFLECPEKELWPRLTERARTDDTEEGIKKRLKTYEDEKPVRDHLQNGGPFEKVRGSGSKEEVFNNAKIMLRKLMASLE